MKPEEHVCDRCNIPMVQIAFVGTKQSGKSYRQRWFKCPVCDNVVKVYACGVLDEQIRPMEAIKAVDKQFKSEERARL